MSKRDNLTTEEETLKPYTIICGQPKRIDCHLDDGSLDLFWAKSKRDVIDHLLRTKDPLVRSIPLDTSSGYTHSPSEYHFFHCFDETCPCSKYVMCQNCEEAMEALPKGGVTIECNGVKEVLTDASNEPSCCQCKEPNFHKEDKVDVALRAIENFFDSDYCFKLVELNVVQISGGGSDGAKHKKAKK